MRDDHLENSNKPKFSGRIIGIDKNNYLQRSSQVHILRDDLCLGVLPITGSSRNHHEFDVELVGQDVDTAIKVLSSLKRIHPRNIKKSVCDIVNELAQNLAYSGFVRYEIVKQEQGVSLHYIPDTYFYDIGIAGVQIIPRQQREHIKKSVIAKTKKHIWKLSFPSEICNWRCYLNILDSLAKNTPSIPLQIGMDELYDPSIGFNMNLYNEESKKYIYHLLNKIGGAQRDMSLNHATEFYIVNRIIRLNVSKALLREHIVSEINQLFKRLKINSNIIISGIPSSDDISDVLIELREGKLGVNDALKKTTL